jgi:hypothetical protein
MNDKISIIIRVMPNGDELDVELPLLSTGREIVGELLDAGIAPKADNSGNPYIYELFSKVSNVKIEEHKTLYDMNISDGDIVYFVPKLVAGAIFLQAH